MSNMFDRALQLDRQTQGQGQQLGSSMFDRAMQIQAEEDAKAQANMPKTGEPANTETGERGFFDAAISGVKAGTAGVFGGQLDFANTFAGVGGDAADYMNDVAQSNARRKTYTIAEMLPFASDYWTNPEGATYDAASQVGSMAALGGEAALLSAGMSAAGIGGAGALASTAAAKAAQMGLPWLARILNSKAGVAMVGNMLTTPFEAGSEAGSTGRTVRDEGGSEDEQQSAALKNFGVQMGLLGITNTLESIGFGRLIAEAGGKRAFTKTLAGLFGNAAQQMYEEGAQTTADEYARGKQTIANVFNPAGWSDEAWDSAGAGFTGGLILGTGARAAGHVLNRNTTTAENFGEDAVNGALEEGRASANEQTETTQDATEPAANNISEKEAFINAIGGQESGGNYDAVNGRTGAAGKYQIMPDNWPQWAEEAGLSRDAEMTPENQEIVARFKLGQYYDKYGARGAAIAWYAGEGALEYSDDALNRKQGNGDEPSINEYADSILARMGEAGNTNSSSPDYNAARDYLRSQLEEMEAGEEYNSIDDTLNNGSRDDVISLAIQRGFGRQEETQTTQQPEQTGEETQQPEGEQGGLSVTDAIDNVRDTTQKVVQNGGQPTFNQPTPQEPTTVTPVETPAVDTVRGQQGNIVTDTQPTQTTGEVQQPAGEQRPAEPHKPSTKAETQLANLQKKFKNIADRGEHLGVQLSPERITELREVAETGDAGRVIDMAKRYKLRAGKDLREMAKQQREAQKQPVEQFNPDAGNVQEPTSESTESGSQTVQTPQEQGGDNSFEQVRGEMSEYIQKLKPTSGKLGKLGSVSTFLHKALKAKRITPQQLGQLKKEAADIIEGKTPTSETVEPNTRAQKDEYTSGGDGLTKEPAVTDNKGTEAQNVADNEGGEVNGSTEERSGVGDLPRADGKVQTEQGRTSESGSVQERPEGHGELGSVQGVRGRVRLNEGGEANGNTEERGRVGDLPRNDSGSGERPSVREVGEEKNRNVQERPEGQDELGGVQRINEDVQLKHKTPKGADKVNALRKKQGLPALNFYVSDDREAFSASLARAKAENSYGDYVDGKSPEELEGCTLITVEGADAGVAITPDGDIVAVHNGSDIKHLGQSLLLLARENGGKKMDCFGKHLVYLYNETGFKAVSKVPYAKGVVNSKLLDENKPDVFALLVTEDTNEQIIKNISNDAVVYQTEEELDALPTYEGANGYDGALSFRDSELYLGDLVAQMRKAGVKKRQADEVKVLLHARAATVYPDNPMQYFAEHPLTFENGKLSAKGDEQYYQSAYHGTPNVFDTFDLSYLGSGEGQQIHGYGFYFAASREIADERYRKRLSLRKAPQKVRLNGKEYTRTESDNQRYPWKDENKKSVTDSVLNTILRAVDTAGSTENVVQLLESNIELWSDRFMAKEKEQCRQALKMLKDSKDFSIVYDNSGMLLEVEIPDSDLMLDEQKTLDEQPVKVKNALVQLAEKMVRDSNGYYNLFSDAVLRAKGVTGGEIYKYLTRSLGSQKEASVLLNQTGVEGITYVGETDGRCYVVFNDQAIKIVKRYDQVANGERKGSIGWDKQGRAIISMFKGNDASTVIHETGHYFIEALATDVEAGRATAQQKADLNKLLNYAGLKGYEEWRKLSFGGRRDAHEKLARAFEQYVMEGKAPSEELKPTFARFKKWLVEIYKSIKDFLANNKDAAPLTDEVRRVFDRMLTAQEEGQNGSKSEPKNRKTETGDNVQAEVHQERAEESNNQDEVTAEPDSWRTAADDLLGADFNKLMDEATTTRQRRRRNREAQEREEAETVAAVRAVELTAEEQQERQAADAVNSYIDSLPTTKKAAIAKHFKNKPDRKDFCARVVTKNPKVTMRERISPSGRDNSEYFVTYDGIELPEKISKNEAQVIAGVAKVKIEKQAPQPAKLPEKPAKPKYLAEIPKTAVKDFLNEVSEKLGPQVASRYLDELMKISGDNGMTWGKSIRNGVFKDLQSRGGINESGWYAENLMRLKDGEAQDALYMYLWDKYAPLVKKTSRGEYNNGDNFNLSEQEMLNEFKRIMGKSTSDEQAQHVLDYAKSVYPNINLDELPTSELKRLVSEAQEARPVEDEIVRNADGGVSDEELAALIAAAKANLAKASGRQYQIAGLNASTANYTAFNEAQTMRKKGKPIREIFEKTGWIYGRDGKWRFVIPDRLDLVDYTKLKNGKAKLSEVYPHELLYKAYPWLKDIEVVVRNIDALGASDTTLKRIVLSPGVVNGTEASELTRDSRTTLLHEMQHHIQHFEQFAEGGSPETARKIIQERIDTLVDEAASASKWYRGYYEARLAYEDMLADKNVSNERKTKAERELRAFEDEYIPNPRSRAAIMRAMREADQLRNALKKYSNDQLYDMLYGEREAQRVERDAAIREIAEQAVKDGDDRKLLQALTARDNNILRDDDKTNPLYDKDVIVVFGNEKARALQMSANRNNDKLDSFDAQLLSSLIQVGDALIRNGYTKAGAFRNTMTTLFIEQADRVRPLLDSIWEFLRKLPRDVAVKGKEKGKEMLQALVVAGRAFNDNITSTKMKAMLKNGMPDLYNKIKDYLDAAFAAIRHYPRQNSGNVVELNKENEGGGSDEHVRVAGTDVEGSNSGRAGEPLERRAGSADGGSESESQTRNNQTNGRNVLGRFGLSDDNSSLHGSGTDTGGEQSNQQGGSQNASNTQRSTRGAERAGSGRPDGTRNDVTEGEVGRNTETDASVRGTADAQFGEQSAPSIRGIQTAEQQGTTAKRSNLTTKNIPIEAGNAENVRRTLPLLFKEQQDDVVKTEKRMFKDNGKGMLLANGTGTGKTLTGLGVIKRFMMQGKRNILIVVPTSDIANNWVYEGQRLGIDGMNTITTNKFTPDDINIITYASLYQNKTLLDNQWDLIVCDESHYLASGSKSTEENPTSKVQAMRAIIGHEKGFFGWMLLKHGTLVKQVENLGEETARLQKKAIYLSIQGKSKEAATLREQAKKVAAQYQEALAKLSALERKEEPLFKEYQRKNNSKVLMLSATPFSYSADVYAAEGILFSYDEYGDYRGFMVDRLGYGITENGNLRAPKDSNTANEVAFHDQLVASGAMSNRRLMVDKDYNRKFVQVNSGIGADIDAGFSVITNPQNGYSEDFMKFMVKRFDYLAIRRVLESIKAEASIPMIKEYIKQGKKVVVFHDLKKEAELVHPFKLESGELKNVASDMQEEYKRFSREHPELINLDVGKLKPTLDIMREAFGSDVPVVNGDISKQNRAQAVRIFNDDNYTNDGNRNDNTDGKLIVVTTDAGKEGISLHDTSGKYPRVLINLGMPIKPTDVIQLEGRIYRVGQASNAMFRYLATGTSLEKNIFTERVNKRSRSAENMALGSEARALDISFTTDFLAAVEDLRTGKFDVTKDNEDSGGKAADSRSLEQLIKDIRKLNIKDSIMQAKVDELVESYKTERDENIRREMLTPANERRFVTKLKEAFNAKGVVKAADGVYVVQLPIPRNVWIDLNTSQAEVLADMSEAEKKRLRSAADVQTSNFRIQGFYEPRGYLKEAGNRAVDIIHLTEAAEDGTIHHEFFHFVHNVLLKTKEKKWLAEYYLRKLRKEIGAEAFNAMSSAERMNRVYEMEAEDYRRFVKMQESIKGPLANLFNRFRNFVAQIADAIGLHTPYGLYLQVRSGKLYTRGVAKNSARKAAAQADAEAMQAQAGPEVLQVAEREDGTRQYSIAEDGTIDGKRTKDDIAATLAAANERAEKAAEEGGIIVKEREKTDLEKKGEAPVFFKELVSSPSRIAEKYPVFKSFYNIYKRAQDTQEKLRNRWNKNFNTALGHLKTEEDMEQFLDLQVSGEMEQQEYTAKQLLGDGYSENVVKAYTQTRQLIRNIWGAVNDAHRGLKTYNEKVDTKGLRSLVNDKFVENLVIKDDISGKFVPARGYKPVPGMEYEVRYDKAKVYKSTRPEPMSQEQLDELRQSPYVKVTGVKKVDFYGGVLQYYEVTTERVTPPIGKITGYLPHMFEQWMVMVETEDGMRPIGSGKTLKEAYAEANKFQKSNPKLKIYVEPKVFDPNTFMGDGDESSSGKFTGSDAVVVSDSDYIRLARALVENNRMSVAEAKAALDGAVRRSGRNRFFGALRQRKGRTGYNTDIIATLGRYITQSSRYVAMQPAKSTAIPLYERTFRKSYETKTSTPMERLIQDYIRYNNGTPTKWEKELNEWLNSMPWWRDNLQATYGDRAALALTNKINSQVSKAKLGFLNVSSAIVNMSQLMNTIGLIGYEATGKGIAAMQRMNTLDKRVIIETGVRDNIGMDSSGGFSADRRGGSDWRKKKATTALGKFWQAYNDIADKSMILFKKTDTITRLSTTLGAYYYGIDQGMSHKQAIAYARDINNKANFDYGAADAPGAFRKLSGTIVGDLFLMFRKYPIKELEMMAEMAPWSNRSTMAQKARFWGTYFMLAGLFGFPGADYLDELLEQLLGYKPSVLAKAWLFKTFGDSKLTRALAYGMGGAAGVDVSRRVGLADVVPSEDSLWKLVGGPTGSTITQFVTAAANGDGAGVVKAWSPALGHAVDAWRGYRTNTKGQVAARYEGLDRALKATGFRPVEEAITGDMQSAVYAERTRYRNERAAVMRRVAEKQLNGEQLTKEDYDDLRRLKVTGKQLMDARRKMGMTNKERIQDSLTRRDRENFAGTPLDE